MDLPRHRTMALSRYAYDVGVTLPEFLVRLHLAPPTAATSLIEDGLFQLDGVVLRDPALVVTSQRVRNGSVASLLDQHVTIMFWADDNGLR
jgi:hypothetical protein